VTVANTTIDVAHAAVHAAIAARIAEVDDTAVQLHRHTYDELTEQMVIVAGIDSGDEDAAELGDQRRHERYTIVVLVDVDMQGATPTAVFTRCTELYQLVRDAVHADPTLGHTVERAAVRGFTSPGAQPRQSLDGALMSMEIRVAIRARINARSTP
jgi:hypothetical protein